MYRKGEIITRNEISTLFQLSPHHFLHDAILSNIYFTKKEKRLIVIDYQTFHVPKTGLEPAQP